MPYSRKTKSAETQELKSSNRKPKTLLDQSIWLGVWSSPDPGRRLTFILTENHLNIFLDKLKYMNIIYINMIY